MTSKFNEKIFFYFSDPVPPERGAYQHSTVCLAEGLKSLGIPFYSNINFWKLSLDPDDYLFQYNPAVTPDDCAIVVLDCDWFVNNSEFPERLFHPKRNYQTVYFERPAGAINLPHNAWQTEFRQFNFIFRTHYNHRFKYPTNVHPWAFGISNRILQELNHPTEFQQRKQNVLVNFRLGHPLRQAIQEEFLPLIQDRLGVDALIDQVDPKLMGSYHHLQWVQTGMRHYPMYYTRLQNSVACACFGGLFINPYPPDAFGPKNFWDRVINQILIKVDSRPRRLMNWDSFRFWESLAAGCVTLHMDLAKYGAILPVMPENWKHYIGLDWNDMSTAADRIMAESAMLEAIANQGRQWALDHYSPIPTAQRFLEIVTQGKSRGIG